MTLTQQKEMPSHIDPDTVPSGGERDSIIGFLDRHLIGPFDGPDEVLVDAPHRRYLMGILFPQESPTSGMLEEEVEEGFGATAREEVAEDPVALSNSWMPSSVGLTFFLSGTGRLACLLSGARYEAVLEGRKQSWRRVAIADRDNPERVELTPTASRRAVLTDRAEVYSYWRPLGNGHLVTVVLMNSQRGTPRASAEGGSETNPALCLYQIGLECVAVGGAVMEYPSVDALSRDPEDEELRLIHRRSKVFAIGHGCAADWREQDLPPEAPRFVSSVRAAFIPTFELPALTHEGPGDAGVLRISRLADPRDDPAGLMADLREFAARYENWSDHLHERHPDIPAELNPAAERVLHRLRDVAQRLRDGISALEGDPQLLRAFRLANAAMLMQMRHADKDVAGTRRPRGAGVLFRGDYLDSARQWRPFQLAFLLLCIPSVANSDAHDRDVVDLLWFPTGGGKTEAYLALASLQILLRRLRSGDRGAGTAVITRYTLRLLTAQQFQRAATVVCALEFIRRANEAEMGGTPISIGLWVGEDQSPNNLASASELREEMLQQPRPVNKFQIEQCPWCGTEIVPEERVEDEAAYGVSVSNMEFKLFCPSADCPFHNKLPISVVDDDLYRAPPSFLLATVDKFARLAWVEDAVTFFGGGRYDPPSLIIQDEMHLLSGPLGTTVAVYEAAVEALMVHHGARPKILASTATIRNAGEQVRGLFGRPVKVFPPPGLSADDSYFATVHRGAPGRRYVGIMAQSHTPQTTIVHTAAALLQAPVELALSAETKDAYWTLVAYHNSIRELGRTATLARDDIPSRVALIATDQSKVREIDEPDVVELTGSVGGDELTRILSRLNQSAPNDDSVSVLITTNMLSVGVDIPRLGIMLVNGQPKTSSEYIQATSRVGRSRVPGLVIAMYNSTKPRDRSHYESFRPYHSALYRYVEPTSVTPFSLPSRERSLHAALVILVRHGAGLATNDAAGRFDPDAPEARRAVESLLERVRRIDAAEFDATRSHLSRLVREWTDKAAQAKREGRPLFYRASGRQHLSLLKDFGASGDGWPTLHSMRNVDRQCNVTIQGERQ